MAETEPLLSADTYDARTELPGAASANPTTSWHPSMDELLRDHPDQLVRVLQEVGVTKLGQIRCQDSRLARRLDAGCLLTAAAASPDVPWPQLWSKQLGVALDLMRVQVEGGPQPVQGGQQSALVERRLHSPGQMWTFLKHLVLNRRLHGAVAADKWAAEARFDCFLVNVRGAAAPGSGGLLHALLRRYREGAAPLAAFGLPAVQAVIQHKWTTFAQRLLLLDLACFSLWLASFTTFMILYTDEDATLTLAELVQTWRGCTTLACDLLVLLAMSPFVMVEFLAISSQADLWWFWSFWKALDLVIYATQIVISSLHFSRFAVSEQLLPVLIGTQYVFMWFRLQYFSRAFRSTRFDFMDSLQVVMADVWWYLLVMLLLMWGFAGSFFMLFKGDHTGGISTEQFATLPLSLLTMFNYAVGGTSYYIGDMLHGKRPAAAVTLCIAYQFVVSMVLMSLLTGVMANALIKVTASQGLRLLASRAEIISELESLRPVARLMGQGSIATWHPPYIYVLRLDPSCQEVVDPRRLWTSLANAAEMSVGPSPGVGASAAGTGQGSSQEQGQSGATAEVVEALSGRVAGLERKIDQLCNCMEAVQRLLERQGAAQDGAGLSS